jgi:acetolactate synthase-1/2/3 large subunit
MSRTVAQYIIHRLEREVDHAFCLVGGASIFLIDALNGSKITPIFNLHEQACTIAADAYGQYTNRLGLAIVTAGPGSLNALTGVAAAFIDSTPMIILSGQANSFHLSNWRLRSKGIQEVKTEDIVKSITKKVYTCIDAEEIPTILEAAIYLAKNGRPGPVWLDIPLDIQNTILKEEAPKYYSFPTPKPCESIYYFLYKLVEAKRPVILVGNGVRLSGAEEKLKEILEKLKIPILTTWRAIDLFEENHPLYVGRPGMIGQRGANWVIQNCDLLLCLGARLDLASVAFDYKNFAPKAMKFVVDIDLAELNKIDIDESWLTLGYDLNSLLHQLNNYLDQFPYQRYENSEWLAECKKLHNQPIEIIPPSGSSLSLYQFIDKLTPYLEDKIVVVGSSGTISEVFCQSFKVPKGCRVIQSNGLGSMGFGLPAAIGAHYASGKPIVMLDGDGSFALNMQELSLVSAKQLPITMIIINNGGYVSIRNTQDNICEGRRLGSNLDNGLILPKYSKVAECFDIEYYDMYYYFREKLIERIFNNDNWDCPCIIEVYTDPNHKTQCRTTTTKQADGTMKASGLENLWP